MRFSSLARLLNHTQMLSTDHNAMRDCLRQTCLKLLTLVVLVGLVGCQFTPRGQNTDGVRQFQTGDYQGAAASFQQALRLNPRDPDAYYNLGALYHRYAEVQKDPNVMTQAETFYQQALALNPNHVEAHRGYAVLLGETNRSTQAFDSLKQWVTTSPNVADARIELARFYQEHGDRASAEQYLQQALQLDQNNARAWAAVGKLRDEAADYSQALANYQRAYQLNPNQPQIAERVAVLQKSGYYAPPIIAPAPSGTRVVDATGPMRRF